VSYTGEASKSTNFGGEIKMGFSAFFPNLGYETLLQSGLESGLTPGKPSLAVFADRATNDIVALR
jgi:hypothetical protein